MVKIFTVFVKSLEGESTQLKRKGKFMFKNMKLQNIFPCFVNKAVGRG